MIYLNMINRIQLPFEHDVNYYGEIISAFENNIISINVWNAVKRMKVIQDDILYPIIEIIEEAL